METCACNRSLVSSEDEANVEEEKLDPRIQLELERLNRASEEINKLEVVLDDARAGFRATLAESTQKLDTMSKKLGSCVEKARPYYQARMNAKLIQAETQKATLRFERACSMNAAAKEMVNVAEQGFLTKGQLFDTAWQEMLNHATSKVNEAEIEILESDLEHQKMTYIFNESEQKVKKLQREFRRSIAKSRPYFEMKGQFNQIMEEQKRRVSRLEAAVKQQKTLYSRTLNGLESISDQIHAERARRQAREALGQRGTGVGAEAPAPAPGETRENSFPDSGGEVTCSIRSVAESDMESATIVINVSSKRADSLSRIYKAPASLPDSDNERQRASPGLSVRRSEPLDPNALVLNVGALQGVHEFPSLPYNKVIKAKRVASETSLATKPIESAVEAGSLPEHKPAVVGLVPTSASATLLSPQTSVNDDADGSDSESRCSSANMPDDDVIEHAMNDVNLPDYINDTVQERQKYMTLPAKLNYLEYYMKYQCNITEASALSDGEDD